MPKADATYICSPWPAILRETPCPKGGPHHTPFPAGYLTAQEYASQLMYEGWSGEIPCDYCGLYAQWIPPEPQPVPPFRAVFDDPEFIAWDKKQWEWDKQDGAE